MRRVAQIDGKFGNLSGMGCAGSERATPSAPQLGWLALGAILATFGRMIFEAGLLRRRASTDYDEEVADGKVVVLIASGNQAADEHR